MSNKLSEYFNLDANPQLSANVKRVFDIFNGDLTTRAEAVKTGVGNLSNGAESQTDLRETARFAWFMADDISLSNMGEDTSLNEALNYPLTGQIGRENILDKFYAQAREMDFRKMDYSCLSGNDRTPRLDNGLTKSENDFIKSVQFTLMAQTLSTKGKENREYYLNRRAKLTPIEIYKEELNHEYATIVGNGYELYAFVKNGYTARFSEEDRVANLREYERDVSDTDISSKSMVTTQIIAINEQIYAYRMAMVNGEEHVPEPVLKFKMNDKWNFEAVDMCIEAFNRGDSPNPNAIDIVNAIMDAHTRHMTLALDRPKDEDFLSQIYIDGHSVKDYFQAPEGMNKADKYYFYSANFLKALYSGEHHVETPVRYMDRNGDMKVTFMSYEPDLTPLAQEEKEANHSWFRRTFFDWGPFKIKTCKTRQKALKAADTKANADARHQDIENRYRIVSATTDNPKKILSDDNEPDLVKSMKNVNKYNKKDIQVWREDNLTKYQSKVYLENNKYMLTDLRTILFNNIQAINDSANNCYFRDFYVVAAEKYGVGNAISLISRLVNASNNPESLITQEQKKMVNEIGSEITNHAYISSKCPEIVTKSLDYIFRNGGIENPDAGVTLDFLKDIAQRNPQKNFVNAVIKLNKPTVEIQEKCGEIEQALKDDPNAKVSAKDLEFLNNKILEQKINEMLCNKMNQELANGQFTEATYNSEGAKIISHYFGENNNEYNTLVQEAKSNHKSIFENDSAQSVLTSVYRNIGKISEDFTNSVQKVLDRANKKVDEPEVAAEDAKQVDKQQKIPDNKVVAPVPQV